jgi:hypothetical protein
MNLLKKNFRASTVALILASLLSTLIINFGTSITPANAVATCAQGGACVVGNTGPGGGIVFYVATLSFTETGAPCDTSCLYLEAAPISGSNAWTDATYAWSGNTSDAIGTTSDAIGGGYSNTSKMILQDSTVGKAGTISRAFRGPNGLSDWFLPSLNELVTLYNAMSTSGLGLTTNVYWSSTEDWGAYNVAYNAANSAWGEKFSKLQSGPLYKSSTVNYVRPIRAFGLLATPSTPTLASVVGGDKQLTISFTAGANGGTAITDYEYSLNGGAFTSAGTITSPFTVTGLSGRTAHSVTLKARNIVGLSTASNSLSATTTDASLDASEAATEVARLAAIELARVSAASEATKKTKEQRELTQILALIPKIGELTLTLGETTQSLYSTKCVKGKTVKYVNKGSKCPSGYLKK